MKNGKSKNVLRDNIIGGRKKGRTRKKRMQDVERELRIIGVKGRKELTQRRNRYRTVIKEAKVYIGP